MDALTLAKIEGKVERKCREGRRIEWMDNIGEYRKLQYSDKNRRRRRSPISSSSEEQKEDGGANLSVSKRYRGYLYDRERDTYFRILRSGGNNVDLCFPTYDTIQRLGLSEPCPTVKMPGENYLQLNYKLSLNGSCTSKTKIMESMRRCRIRDLNLSKEIFNDCCHMSRRTLIRPDKRGIFSFFNRDTDLAFVAHQDIVTDSRRRLKFRKAVYSFAIDEMSEAVWKDGAPLENNDLVCLQNAPFSKPSLGVALRILRLGNMADIELKSLFLHRLRLVGHCQALAWCPLREMIIIGTERESIILEVMNKKTYQVSASHVHAHLFHTDSLYCGGLSEVRHFDLRESLRYSQGTIRLNEASVAKQLRFMPRRNSLLVGCAGGRVTQWDTRNTTAPLAVFDNSRGYSTSCSPLNVDETESFLTCVDVGHATHVWDIQTARLLRCLPNRQREVCESTLYDLDNLFAFSEEGICTYSTFS